MKPEVNFLPVRKRRRAPQTGKIRNLAQWQRPRQSQTLEETHPLVGWTRVIVRQRKARDLPG